VSYRVRRLRPAAILTAVVPAAAVIYFASRLAAAPPLFLAAVALVCLSSLWSGSLQFAVDAKGVRFGGALQRRNDRQSPFVPWSSVQEVVVWNTGPAGLVAGTPEVGVRLRPDAPLPRGVRSLVHDPAHPDAVAPELRTTVPNLDHERLAAAVQAHGGGVPLVDGG
jgi:hypothetical protein